MKVRKKAKFNKLVLKIILVVLVLMLGLIFMEETEYLSLNKTKDVLLGANSPILSIAQAKAEMKNPEVENELKEEEAKTPAEKQEVKVPSTVTPEMEEPSLLEKVFAKRAFLEVSRNIKQFGYEIFQQPPDTFAPVTNVPVGADYVLGPEDGLIIHIWGKVNETYRVSIDRDGKIILPKIGALYLWGLTFSEAQKLIKDNFSTFYSGIQIDISIGSLRTIKVFVLGNVKKPGSYNLSALSTILHSLYQAGGPTKEGSLRKIKLIRKNKIIEDFDLYELLLEGIKSKDLRLQSNDIVFVPSIGDVVAICGSVKKPAIYESKGETRLSELIKIAQGITPLAYLQQIQVERIEANKKRVMVNLKFQNLADLTKSPQNIELRDGDVVLISSILPEKHNFVTVQGNILRPGEYELEPGMKISDLIDEARGILPETYLERGEIFRFRSDRTREVIPFNLGLLLEGDKNEDIGLNEWDIVSISSIYDIYPEPFVQISGEVHKPGKYRFVQGMRISDLLFRGKEPTKNAYLEQAELYRRNFDKIEAPEIIVVNLAKVKEEKDLEAEDKKEDVLLEKSDHFFVRANPELVGEPTVSIAGEVAYPGPYVIRKGERLSSVIERAEGYTDYAFLKGAIFTRKPLKNKQKSLIEQFIRSQKEILLQNKGLLAESILPKEEKEEKWEALQCREKLLEMMAAREPQGRIIMNLTELSKLGNSNDDILLEDGDVLKIPQIPDSVLIVGAVYNPESVIYLPDRDLQFYLNKVGGPTKDAKVEEIYVIKPNGEVESKATGIGKITRGDIIVVPTEFETEVRP